MIDEAIQLACSREATCRESRRRQRENYFLQTAFVGVMIISLMIPAPIAAWAQVASILLVLSVFGEIRQERRHQRDLASAGLPRAIARSQTRAVPSRRYGS